MRIQLALILLTGLSPVALGAGAPPPLVPLAEKPTTPSIDPNELFTPLFENPVSSAASRAFRFGNFGLAARLAWKAILSGELPPGEKRALSFLHALALQRSGQRSNAITAFRTLLADGQPRGLSQHAHWYHGKLLLESGLLKNLKEARQSLIGVPPSSRFGHKARIRLIQALLNAGELQDACELAQQSVSHYRESYREAGARYLLGRCRHRQGWTEGRERLREAAGIYREVATIWPRTPAGLSAKEHLEKLKARRIFPKPYHPAPLLERAGKIAGRIRSKRDLFTLKRIRTLLPRSPKDPSRTELDLLYAELCTRHRWFKTAAYTLRRVLKRAPLPEQKARASFALAGLTSRRSPMGAVAEYLAVQKNFPESSVAPLALYKAGDISRRYRDAQGGLRAFVRCVEKYPDTSAAAHCRWGLAWLEYSQGNYKKALPWMEFLLAATDLFPDRLEELLQSSPDQQPEDEPENGQPEEPEELEVPLEESEESEEAHQEPDDEPAEPKAETPVEVKHRRFLERACYWRARSLEQTGQTGKALEAYRRLVEQHPYDYYSLMAKERLALLGKKAECPLPPSVDDKRLKQSMDLNAHNPEVLAAIAYLRMGLPSECRETLRTLPREGLSDKDRRLASLLWLALGDIRLSHRLSPLPWEGGLPPQTKAGPPAEASSQALRRLDATLAYPKAYAEIVESPARDAEVPPALLFALMRAESGFKARARSTARALGLTQVVRRTAYRTARRIKLRGFRFWKLYQPDVSIRVGSAYLGQLLRRYQGNPALALAAYNAGERAVSRWLARRGELPLDAFIEEIPFAETNRYVKKVLSFYAIYRGLYEAAADKPLDIDFTLPKKPVDAAKKFIWELKKKKEAARQDRTGQP